MLTYIVRRLLYSIPVLIISTFLSFTFVSLAGNPTLLGPTWNIESWAWSS